jgi:hypothetical protein
LPDGSVRIPLLRLNLTRDERENYTVTRKYLDDHLVKERRPEDEITGEHRDVAAALQECLDKVMLHICGHFGAVTGLRRLALAGGVALNCTANGRLMKSGLFDEIYIQPAAGDDGSALGAALYRAALAGDVRNMRFPPPFHAPSGLPCPSTVISRTKACGITWQRPVLMASGMTVTSVEDFAPTSHPNPLQKAQRAQAGRPRYGCERMASGV